VIGVLSAVRDLGRLREITAVLVRHGFGEIVARAGLGRRKRESPGASDPPRSADGGDAPAEITPEDAARGEDEKRRISVAERVRLVLQDLGPSFIKLGQIASTRTDVLPPEVILELKKLQDDVPAVAFAEIRHVVQESLGAPIDQLFVTFDERPLATASIGQVHRAVLRTPAGDLDVVLKVQRPGVATTVARDLDILHVLAATLERTIPETKIYSPRGLVDQFDASITSELNFLVEADNAERFAKNFAGSPHVRFPKVYRQATAKRVLALEFFDGKKIDVAVAGGVDGPSIAKKAVAVVVKMIFEDGFFHADPHPGNIFILGGADDPVIGLIDVGMVGRLSPELRELTIDLMVAAARNDATAVADALYAIGRPTKKIDMRAYRAEVAVLSEKYLGRPLREIDLSAMLRDLVQGAMKYGLEIPTDFMLVGKSLMTIEGIGKALDPNLDVFGEASPHFMALLRKRYSPERLGMEMWRVAEQMSRVGYDVPMHLREVLDDLRLGRLSVRTVDPALPHAADRLGRRVFSALTLATLLASGTVLLARGTHETLGVMMLIAAAIVWLVHTAADLRRGRNKSSL
jgi:ubiquinone biosynthesis protein